VTRANTALPLSLIAGDNLLVDIVEKEDLANFLTKLSAQFLGPGGAVLYLYSLVFARGLDLCQMDLKVGAYGMLRRELS
jgi:hypothetical protein